MFLKLQCISDDILAESLSYFRKDYIKSLKNKPTFSESISARYLISQRIGMNYMPSENEVGIPVYTDENYWSLSHKKDLLFVWVSDTCIWVDVEINKSRDQSVLDIFSEKEYELLGSRNWENFYVLWTATESLLKYNRDKKYIEWQYKLQEKQDIDMNISWIDFTLKLIFERNRVHYTTFSNIKGNIIYSIYCKINE